MTPLLMVREGEWTWEHFPYFLYFALTTVSLGELYKPHAQSQVGPLPSHKVSGSVTKSCLEGKKWTFISYSYDLCNNINYYDSIKQSHITSTLNSGAQYMKQYKMLINTFWHGSQCLTMCHTYHMYVFACLCTEEENPNTKISNGNGCLYQLLIRCSAPGWVPYMSHPICPSQSPSEVIPNKIPMNQMIK